MNYLGIDYGDSRIGLSVSDGLCLTAQPLGVVHVKNGWKNALPELHKYMIDREIESIVIGYPFNEDGTLNKRCEVTDRFLDVLLKDFSDIEVIKWDERYSTLEANEVLLMIGKKKQRNKKSGRNDIIASQMILQSYLDFLREKK